MAYNVPIIRLIAMCAIPRTADQLAEYFAAHPQGGLVPDHGFKQALPAALSVLAGAGWLATQGTPLRYMAAQDAIGNAADDETISELTIRHFIPVPHR